MNENSFSSNPLRETAKRQIWSQNSTEMVHGVPMSSRAILSMPSSRKSIPVQLFVVVVFGRWRTSSSEMNLLQMSGVRWFGSLLFQLFPSFCILWRAIMSTRNLYFQSKRSPILRNCCAHSTTAACSVWARSETRYVSSCNHMYFENNTSFKHVLPFFAISDLECVFSNVQRPRLRLDEWSSARSFRSGWVQSVIALLWIIVRSVCA